MKMKIAIYDAGRKAGKFSEIQNKHGGNKTSNNGNRRHLRKNGEKFIHLAMTEIS
jgi:hypothetical protein